jgi:fibronectin-binding autotransporter adhesin
MGRPSSFLLASVSTLALLTATPSSADTVNWIGPDGGTWDDGNNWDSAQPPQAGQDTNLTQSTATDQTAVFQNPAPGTLNSLVIDGTGGGLMALSHQQDALSSNSLTIGAAGKGQYALDGTGALTVSGDLVLGSQAGNESPNSKGTFNFNTQGGTATLSVSGTIVVGDSGDGVFNQGAGTVSANVVIGRNVGSNGTYNLLGGGAVTPTPPILNDDLIVGDAGTGTFNNSGGAHTVSGNLILGNQATGKGTYNLSGGGTLDVVADALGNANLIIGNDGKGQFIHTDGSTATVAGSVVLGNNSGGAGRYRLDSGTLNVGGELSIGGSDQLTTTIVGGTGHFVQNDGTVNVGNTLFVGNAGGTGTYDLHGGTLDATNGGTSANPVSFVGNTSIGTFNQDGGAHITDFLGVGTIGGGNGTYNLSGGTVQVQGNLGIGGDTSSGLIDQTGGTVTVGGTIFMNGNGNANSAKYKLSGDPNTVSLTVTGNTIVGANGLAGSVFEQSGGTHTIGGDLNIGRSSGGHGTYTYNGGTLSVSGLTVVGDFGTGTFNQNADLTLAGGLVVGRNFGSNGTYNMKAGVTLNDDLVVGDAGTGTFNNPGGTHNVTGTLILGNQSTGDGTYKLTAGGTLNVGTSDFTFVGLAGNGTFLNDASTHSTGSLVIGQQTDSTGLYTLQNGGVLHVNGSGATGFMTVGESGTGTYTQTGGTAMIATSLAVGLNSNGTGFLNLSGGSMTVGSFADVGLDGTGFATHKGDATLTVTNDLNIGRNVNSFGQYTVADTATLTVNGTLNIGNAGAGLFTQNGGTLHAKGDENIGITGFGSFTQTAGAHNVGGDLNLGFSDGGLGQYQLSGTGALAVTGTLFLGDAGIGLFSQQDAGTSVTAKSLSVGNDANGFGQYDLKGGTLQTESSFVGASGTGVFNQSGGSHTVTVGGLSIGSNAGGSGTYALSGGTLSVTGGTFLGSGDTGATSIGIMEQSKNSTFTTDGLSLGNGAIGQGYYTLKDSASLTVDGTTFVGGAGLGKFTQSDSSGNTTNFLVLGDSKGSTGTYDLKGGTLTVKNDETVGNFATGASMPAGFQSGGTFNQSGGTHTVGGVLTVAANKGSTGTYNLSGGSLTAGTIVDNDTFTYSGGALKTNTFTNNANTTLSGAGTRTVDGAVVNNGTWTVDHTHAAYTGTFTNSGKYVSDPSTNDFVDFVVTASGSVQGGAGDVFHVTGDFKNASTQATLWTTGQSKLVIDGPGNGNDGKHRLEFAGIDEGATVAGYANNFAWGELDLTSGEEIDVADGNDVAGAAFYTRLFELAGHDLALLAEILSPFNIYYDATLAGNAYLDCKNYDLQGGGDLIAIGDCTVTPPGEVPEPGTLTLLGLGLGGLVFLRRRGRGIEAPQRV